MYKPTLRAISGLLLGLGLGASALAVDSNGFRDINDPIDCTTLYQNASTEQEFRALDSCKHALNLQRFVLNLVQVCNATDAQGNCTVITQKLQYHDADYSSHSRVIPNVDAKPLPSLINDLTVPQKVKSWLFD